MDGCSIFREELAIRYPDYGHALWEPDPRGLYEAVAVGDVGFIRRGYFHRLFNALSPPPDSDSPDGAKYPPHLQPKNPHHLYKSRDGHQAFFSGKVAKLSHQSNFYASGPDDVTFSCSGTRGALSYLPFLADREETSAHGDFRKWMLKYIDDCFKISEAFGCGVNHMGDIILVTGRHLARSWVNVAFSGSSGGAQVSFKVQVTGDHHLHLEERDVSGAELKLGPSGESPPENQCIFVQGYHVVRILNFWPKIRAAGLDSDDMHDPEPETGYDTHLEVVGIPSEADYRDPIHVLFEYIAEQAFNCDMVLVHDNDLGFISGALPSDTLSEYIRNHAPVIQQVRYELSPRTESRSRTEESIVTVATLSRDLFEASCQVQNNLECVQPTDTTNGSDSESSQSVSQENAAPQSSDLCRSKYVSLTDDDLSDDSAIPSPAVSSHNVLPDPDRSQGSSTSSPQSDSRMDIPVSPLNEPTNEPVSMSWTIPSPTPTQCASDENPTPAVCALIPLAHVDARFPGRDHLYTHGYISRTLEPSDAAQYFTRLLSVDERSLQPILLQAWPRAFFITSPVVHNVAHAILVGNRPAWLLDYVLQNYGTVVPQRIWSPRTPSDALRYNNVSLNMPIFFAINDQQRLGLRLVNAAAGDCMSLSNARSTAPVGNCHTTSIRIKWPGYDEWSTQIMTRDNTAPHRTITLGKLAKRVACAVCKFLEDASGHDCANPNWRLGRGGITSSNIILIGLIHVSQGSWQPILELDRYIV